MILRKKDLKPEVKKVTYDSNKIDSPRRDPRPLTYDGRLSYLWLTTGGRPVTEVPTLVPSSLTVTSLLIYFFIF